MTPSHEHWFDHEKLEVYREAIAFVAWLATVKKALCLKFGSGQRLRIR
jgi:hypothetical protein